MISGDGADARATPDKDPMDQGQSIRTWMETLRNGEDVACLGASEALLRIGMELAAALPALAAALQHRSGVPRAQVAAELGQLGARLMAVIPRFRSALRAVVLTDGDETVRTSALHALTLLGPTSKSQVPALVEALRDELPAVRAAAAQDLAQLGTEARESVPALLAACLRDADLAVRVQAGAALWRVGRRHVPALPPLIEGLKSGDEVLCWTAADCLGDMGADAAEAVPALREALVNQQRSLIKTSIALALERIAPPAAAADT